MNNPNLEHSCLLESLFRWLKEGKYGYRLVDQYSHSKLRKDLILFRNAYACIHNLRKINQML